MRLVLPQELELKASSYSFISCVLPSEARAVIPCSCAKAVHF